MAIGVGLTGPRGGSGGGGTCTSRARVRNPDWLDMPALSNGDEEIYLLVAVKENQPNLLSFVVNTSGVDYSVDLYNRILKIN